MNSALLALFVRALREDVRSKSMYWARGGLIAIVLFNLGTTQLTRGWAGAPGLAFFTSVIYINLFFISLAGLSYFSSAITEEKEDMTLGLLRMTNLNPLSILLGKSASRQIGALLLLVSQVPFTLLAVALGGVTLAQIIAAYFCLAAYTLFLGNVALFFSVAMRRSISAASLTFVVLLLFFLGPLIVRYPLLVTLAWFRITPAQAPGPWLDSLLSKWEQASPVARLQEIGITGFSDGPLCFQVGANLVLAAVFFLGAWAIFDVCCRDQAEAGPSRGMLTRGGKRRRVFSPSRPWKNAILWKDYYYLGGGHVGAFLKLAIYVGALGVIAFFMHQASSNPVDWELIASMAVWGSALMTILEIAFIASRVFRQERIWKTWSSLAMLPMTTRRIAYQKVLGNLLCLWPALLLFTVGCASFIGKWWRDFRWTENSGGSFELIAITGSLFAILLAAFFYHLVVQLSLRLKWGALPLAFAITYVGTSICVALSFLIFKEASFVVLDFALGITVVVMHYNIGTRLEKIAAED